MGAGEVVRNVTRESNTKMNNVNTPSVQSFNCYHVLFERCCVSICVWHSHTHSAAAAKMHPYPFTAGQVLRCAYDTLVSPLQLAEWPAAAAKFSFCICASRPSVISLPETGIGFLIHVLFQHT